MGKISYDQQQWSILQETVRIEVLAAVLLEIQVFWDVMVPPLVISYHPTKCLFLFTQQHSMTSQKTWIIIVRDCKISEKDVMTEVYSVQFSKYHVHNIAWVYDWSILPLCMHCALLWSVRPVCPPSHGFWNHCFHIYIQCQNPSTNYIFTTAVWSHAKCHIFAVYIPWHLF